jgi:hypothetical protein
MPILDGPGAAVDVSQMGSLKTFSCTGTLLNASVMFEVSADGGTTWGAIAGFTAGEVTEQAAAPATHMRAHVRGMKAGFAAVATVGGEPGMAAGYTMPLPATASGNGDGASVDVSALGPYRTVIIAGVFTGATIRIDASNDAGASWVPVAQVSNMGVVRLVTSAGALYRVHVSGRRAPVAFSATCTVAGTLVTNSFPVAPGVNRGAAINAAIARASAIYEATGVVQLVQLAPRSSYTIEVPIERLSGVTIDGQGSSITPTYTGGADDPDNYVIGGAGELDLSVMNTAVTADVLMNESTIAVAAAGTIAAGDYILLVTLLGPGVLFAHEELVRVADSYVGGLNIPLAWPLQDSHPATGASTTTAQAITPLFDSEVMDVVLLGSVGGVTTAVGVYGRYGRNLKASDIVGSGLSREIVEHYGCDGVTVDDVHSKGTNNGWTMVTTCQRSITTRTRGTLGVDRVHPLGVPRFPILVRYSNSTITRDCVLEGVACGAFLAGGIGTTWDNLTVRDVEITDDIYNRMVASGELQGGGAIVLGYGSGYGPVPQYAEFAYDVKLSNIHVENLRAPAAAPWNTIPFRAQAFYIHDTFAVQGTNLSAVNRGPSPNVAHVGGMTISDISGALTNVDIWGFSSALYTQNDFNTVDLTAWRLVANAGGSPNATVPILFNHKTPSFIHFHGLILSNWFSEIVFGTEFTANPAMDAQVYIDDLVTDAGQWSHCILSFNGSGVNFAGADVVEIDPASTTRPLIRTPVAAANINRRLAAVVSAQNLGIPGQGHMFICPLPAKRATITCIGDVFVGDSLEPVLAGTRQAQANNAVVDSIGMALEPRAVLDPPGYLAATRSA